MSGGKKLLLEKLIKAVYEYNDGETVKICNEVINKSLGVKEFIFSGLAKGIQEAGVSYNSGEYAIPELLLCADVLESGLNVLKPYLKKGELEKSLTNKIVIGTVKGDIHDIGKNMVKLMLEASGFYVIDLGVDVDIKKFLEAQIKNNAEIIGLSSMMTTTMIIMKDIIKELRKRSTGVKIMIGGASIDEDIADSYNADGYGGDALAAVEEAKRLIKELN